MCFHFEEIWTSGFVDKQDARGFYLRCIDERCEAFERIAPCTYCVRAPYVKDPADGEAILAEARKKIRAFENGLTGPEDLNDLERDEDFECDVDEEPEVDDLVTLASASNGNDLGVANGLSGKGGDDMSCDVKADVNNEAEKEFSPPPSSIKSIVPQYHSKDSAVSCVDDTNAVVEDSNQGQSWIQGLTEGDYCHLSVEERLEALVALVSIVNEGNSLRASLEVQSWFYFISFGHRRT